MRILTTFAFATLLATGAAAQANDYGGLRIFTSSGGAPSRLTCGTAFTCTPTSFTAQPGESPQALLHGRLNGLFVLAASLDTQQFCVPLPLPGVVHDLALNPSLLVTIAVGVCSQPDNGRCNGGFELVPLFTIPSGMGSGAIKFQGALSSPTAGGGTVIAMSNPVVMNF